MILGASHDKTVPCWGQDALPLVPAALRRLAGDVAAPPSLQAAFGRALRLADLDQAIWSAGEIAIGKACLADLVKVLTPLIREHGGVRVVDSDNALPVALEGLAIPAQTARCVATATRGQAIDPTVLTFSDLLAMPQVGPRRTIEIACALEAHLEGRNAAVVPTTVADAAAADETIVVPSTPVSESSAASREHFEQTLAAPNEHFDETMAAPSERFDETIVAPSARFDETIVAPSPRFDETIAAPVEDFRATLAAPHEGFDEAISDMKALVEVDRSAEEAEPPPLAASLIGTVVQPPGERRETDRRQAGRTPREIKTFFRVLAAWASGERGEQTLQNALPQPKPGWPPELVQLWKRVRYCSAPSLAGTLRDRYSVPDLVQQAFAGCDQRHRLILQARVLTTTKPTSLEALASALCLTVHDVRSLQRAALVYLERLQTKPFRPVSGRARIIRERLGCAVPERDPVLKQALDWVVWDFKDFPDSDFARELMLWLAGPYRLKDRWYVTSADLPIRTVEALLEYRNRDGVIETSDVRKVLSRLAIHPKYHEAWIDRVGEFVGVANGLMSASDRVTGRLPTVPPP